MVFTSYPSTRANTSTSTRTLCQVKINGMQAQEKKPSACAYRCILALRHFYGEINTLMLAHVLMLLVKTRLN